MLKKYLFLVLVIFSVFSISSFAQQYKIEGKIVDVNGESIPFALVSVYQEGDSLATKSINSSLDGDFSLSVAPNKYTVYVRFFSFQTKTIPNVVVSNLDLDLGEVVLKPEAKQLEEVVIVTEKNQMMLDLDKRVYNVKENLINAGANAADVLENIPSVSVDVDGNISLRGSENVQVLIDGKPSGLIGSDLAGLNQIQGNMIEKVEVITNPSSRYDAQGGVGIINIVLKKEREVGLNGSFVASTGYPNKQQTSVNLNYRTKKVNFFTGVGVNYRNSPGEGFVRQTFNQPDTVFYYENNKSFKRRDRGYNLQLGADFFVNKQNTITLTGVHKQSRGNNLNTNTYTDFDENRVFFNESTREDNEIEKKNMSEVSIRHEKTYKKKDQKWINYAKLITSNDDENSTITQRFSIPSDSTLNQFSSNLEQETNFLAQSDYVQPIGKAGRMEAGVKSSIKVIENNFSVKQEDENGETAILPVFNNDFKYNENIHAAYAQYGNKIQQLSYQLGVRSEYSDITTTLLRTNEVNQRQYLNFFPSVFLSAPVDSNGTLQLSYSRRISRPRARSFLPFYSFNDNRNLRTGNPNLTPEYTNSFDLGYLHYLDNGSFMANVYYRHSTDVIQRITTSDSSGVTQTLPVNLAVEHAIGLELTANYDFYKWWKTSASVHVFDTKIKGSYNDYVLNRNAFGWRTQLTSKLSLDKKTMFQAMFNYYAKQNTPQGFRKSISSLDLAISRDVLNKKGSLVFGVRDVFNSRRWQSVVDDENYYLESSYLRSKRQFTLTFTYYLSPSQRKQKDRLGGGGNMDDDDF